MCLLDGIFMKLSDLWDAKIEKKKVLKKTITDDYI